MAQATLASPGPLTRLLPASMRYGQFRYYWLALLTGVTGHQMLLNFTLFWLVRDVTGGELWLAALGPAIALPALALNLLGGVLADRWEPKYLVASAQTISATVVVGLATLVAMDQVHLWHIIFAGFVIGAVQAFDQPSRSSIFPRLVLREHIINAVAMENLVWNGVRILGPVLAGFMISGVGIAASIFFSAATFYIMGAVVSLLSLRERPPATGQVVSQVKEGFRYVGSHPLFTMILLLTFCNAMFGMAYIQLMPSFAEEILDKGADKIGFLLGASGVGAICGTLIIANLKDHHRKGMIILGAAMAYGAALVVFSLLAYLDHYLWAMAALVVVGMCSSLYLVGGMSIMQQLVPDRLRGRIMGMYGVCWSLAPLGMVWAGVMANFLGDEYGAPVAVAAGGVAIIGGAVVIMLSSSELRTLRTRMPETQRQSYQLAAAGDGD